MKKMKAIAALCIATSVLGGCRGGVEMKKEDNTTITQNTTVNENNSVSEKATVGIDETMSSAATALVGGYELNPVATVKDSERSLQVENGMSARTEKGYKFYNCSGEPTGEVYVNIDNLKKDDAEDINGYYVVAKDGNYPNVQGVITDKGEEILPCEAAIIKALSDKYLSVTYATEETKSKNDALFYVYTGFASFGGPEKGDTLYKGYMQIYDLENKRFVPNVKITKNTEKAEICGESIYWKKDDGTSSIYNADGQEIFSDSDKSGEIELHNGLFRLDKKIYNDKGEEVEGPRGDMLPEFVNGNTQYIYYMEYSNDKEYSTVVDTDGNIILDRIQKGISSINDDIVCFSVSSESETKYGLMTLQGDEIIEADGKNYSYLQDGFWSGSDDNSNICDIVSKKGIIASNVKPTSNLICNIDGTTNYVILNQKNQTVDLKEEYIDGLTGTLVTLKENSMCGVVDLYNGEKLLNCEYDEITYDAGYLYAYKEGKWTIYEVNKK